MRRLLAFACLLAALGGCAALMGPSAPGPMQKFVVFFPEWSAGLDGPAQAVITAAADAAKQTGNAPVTVIGFADPTGSAEANVYMSRTRAQVVTDALVQDGVAAGRIHRSARGETNFTATSQESRRAEIDVGG